MIILFFLNFFKFLSSLLLLNFHFYNLLLLFKKKTLFFKANFIFIYMYIYNNISDFVSFFFS